MDKNMNYYKICFENGVEQYEWVKSSVSYLTDCENLVLSIQMNNIDPELTNVIAVYRQDQINSDGEVKETQIFPNKEIEDSLLNKKQHNWH